MSIWTTTDRDNVKEAILALATGSRVVSTEVGGKTREFHRTNLPELKAFLTEIVSDIEADSELSGGRRVSTTIKSDTW